MEKLFFHTQDGRHIYLHTWLEMVITIWHILRRLEFKKKKLLPGENRRKCDFCRIKDGGSSRWRIAFQPISSDFFFSIKFFFSIRIFWVRWSLTHTHTHTRWGCTLNSQKLTRHFLLAKRLCFLSRRISRVVSIWPPNDIRNLKKKGGEAKNTHTHDITYTTTTHTTRTWAALL
jgi:hypothetical protein